MSQPTLAELADRAPVGPVPLADPDFMFVGSGSIAPLPEHVLARIKLPVSVDTLCRCLEIFDAAAKREGRVARMHQRANYIEIFTQAKP